MGSADLLSMKYFSRPEVFADAVNCALFNGQNIVNPTELKELDTAEIAVLLEKHEKEFTKRTRDVLKQWSMMTDGNVTYCILGIESQTNVHYAMPIRVMLYDALRYYDQVDKISRQNKAGGKRHLRGGDFLSGFTINDKVIPVITIVIYLGAEPWDGPTCLSDMYPKLNPQIIDLVPEYRIQLLQPQSFSDAEWDRLQTGFGAIMKYIKYSKNKEVLADLTHSDDKYHKMDPIAAELINSVTGSKLMFKEEEGSVDMCLAIDQMREESINVGIQQGKIEGRLEGIIEGRLEGKIEGKIEGAVIALQSIGMTAEDIISTVSQKLLVEPDKVKKVICELQ